MVTDGTGRFTATVGEDCLAIIHEVRGTSSTVNSNAVKPSLAPIATLRGHEAPIIKAAWAPPRAGDGHPLATSSIDGQLHVWKVVSNKDSNQGAASPAPPATGGASKGSGGPLEWAISYSRRFPAPVVSMAWSPEEFGIALACACADGKIYVVDNSNKSSWSVTHFDAHTNCGCTGVSWAPYITPGSLLSMPLVPERGPTGAPIAPPPPVPRLVTCGREPTARVWRYSRAEQMWLHEGDLQDSPASTQRDVAWAPNVGMPFSYIAAASDDKFVTVWLQDGGLDGMWRATALPPFDDAVVKVSWSLVGTFLLVACANNTASIWKEDVQGGWAQVSLLETTAPPPSLPQPGAYPTSSNNANAVAGPSPPPPMPQQQSGFMPPPPHHQQQQQQFSRGQSQHPPQQGPPMFYNPNTPNTRMTPPPMQQPQQHPPMAMQQGQQPPMMGGGAQSPMMMAPPPPQPQQQYQTSMYTR